MLSSIFVDRPRLSVVIAIVTSIAGALALFTIPVAQYPDIVPPQVSVTASYPGASAAVIEQTVAQPLEAQIVGTDKMLYMKSVSGNDGSYSLLVSFELDEILDLADRILVMFGGQIVLERASGQTDERELGVAMTGGKVPA